MIHTFNGSEIEYLIPCLLGSHYQEMWEDEAKQKFSFSPLAEAFDLREVCVLFFPVEME